MNDSSNLTYIGRDGLPVISATTLASTGKVAVSLDSNTNLNLSLLEDFLGPNIKSISWRQYSNIEYFSSEYISNIENCSSIILIGGYTGRISKLDGLDFPQFNVDFSFSATGFGLSTFENVNYINKLKSLNLSNNNISDLKFMCPNQGNSLLEELNLSKNGLGNTTTYFNSEGTKVTESTCSFLLRYSHLMRINLSGNTTLTNFDDLFNAGFKEYKDEPIYKSDRSNNRSLL